jgi:flavin reductase (DIM6/NTAB) family NADH-FMN oxidoreductase RutF
MPTREQSEFVNFVMPQGTAGPKLFDVWRMNDFASREVGLDFVRPMPAKNEVVKVTGLFPYGVYILAASAADQVAAIVATWVMQVSFVPPLVAVAVEKEGAFLKQITSAKQFSLSLLPKDGIEVAKHVLKNGPLFPLQTEGLPFVNGENAPPRPAGAHSTINCKVWGTHAAGDHIVVLGEITGAKTQLSGPVLTLQHTGWIYRRKNQALQDPSSTE